MNQAEYEALADYSISPFVHRLYSLGFRRNMDYESGHVFVSFGGLCAALEFHPPRGSTEAFSRPSKDKIRHGIDVLKRCGLIKLVHKGSIRDNRPAVYCCVLASFSAKRDFCGHFYEPHESTTGTPREPKSLEPVILKASAENVVKFKKRDEPLIPVLPEQEGLTNACARVDLVFDEQFRQFAKQALLVLDDESLEAVFNQFRFNAKDDGSVRPLYLWLNDWRAYCASVRSNDLIRGKRYATSQQVSSVSSSSNATARSLEESRRAAEHCAENGIDGSVLDRIIDLAEGDVKASV